MIDWRRFARKLGVALNLREPPNVPPYGWSYFDHLVSLYVTQNTSDGRADTVIAKSSARPDDLTWGDIFLLENIVFSLQPPEVVNRNAWIVRERLREIACPTVFQKYVESNFPRESDTPAKFALLRADLTRVLDVLHWYYSLIPMRERLRKSLTLRCITYVVLYTAVLAGIYILCYHYKAEFFAMIAGVLYWGILGGFVSSQRRMQRIPNDGDPLLTVFELDSAGYYLWLSPLLGATFAIVLFLMFVAGILEGSIFPTFYSPSTHHRAGLTFFTFTWTTLPISGADYARLFVWSFLAGFAERLVPDNLDRLSSKLGVPDRRKGPSIPPAAGDGNPPSPPPGPAAEQISTDVLQKVMHTGEEPPPTNPDSP
jgi:hypothetical protein